MTLKISVWKMYDKPSAYRSGMLVKLYRESGGRYSGDKDKDDGLPLGLHRNGKIKGEKSGINIKSDVYRPTVRINSKTPTTFQELTTKEIERARREKAKDGKRIDLKIHYYNNLKII
jgi:hypothetical protein